jgi:WD40 repeat protein
MSHSHSLRRFATLDASARVFPSREGDWVLCFDADGAKLYHWNGGYFDRVEIDTLPEASVGAFRHNRLWGTLEVAIICADSSIRRFDLASKQELDPIVVEGASALTYDVGGNVLYVGTYNGQVRAFSLESGKETADLQVSSGEITTLVPPNSTNGFLTVICESGDLWKVDLSSEERLLVEIPKGGFVYAECLSSPACAIAANGEGVLSVGNWNNGTQHDLEVEDAVIDLCFLSPVELAVAMPSSVCVVQLANLHLADEAKMPEIEQVGSPYFDNGQMIWPDSRLNQAPEARYITPVHIDQATRIHAVRSSEGQLVVIYE